MGSAIFVSSAVIHVRKQAFERKLQELAANRERRLGFTFSSSKRRPSTSSNITANTTSAANREPAMVEKPKEGQGDKVNPAVETDTTADESMKGSDVDEPGVPSSKMRIQFADDVNSPMARDYGAGTHSRRQSLSKVFSNSGVGAHGAYYHPRKALPLNISPDDASVTNRIPKSRLNKYVDTINGYIGRNSQFHNLTEEERRKLGGLEYDALCLLSWLVPAYFVLFQLFGALGCGAWMQINRPGLAYSNGKIVINCCFQH